MFFLTQICADLRRICADLRRIRTNLRWIDADFLYDEVPIEPEMNNPRQSVSNQRKSASKNQNITPANSVDRGGHDTYETGKRFNVKITPAICSRHSSFVSRP
ncbi:MAG: hypothetical protein EAZ37_17480 [Burkholderiales bacterium]|nr:MAG: hypothetical protein EAZ37_17480 [Burkholderiales bacterium]